MRHAGHLLVLIFSFLFIQNGFSQEDIPPKREFRAAWVATVANIDFPMGKGYSKEQFTDEWTGILDQLKETGLNAVFAQVRPAGDAFYESRIAPWSKYLSGKQGESLEDGFDPMKMMIEEAHARNIEFHAWLNPYRASMDTIVENLHKKHPVYEHPDWIIQYGGKLYFNPAKPDVRDYITEVVLEILMNYDVDGIHFDDYFYPYPASGETYPDAEDFANYGYGYRSLDTWRRDNVNKLISQVAAMKRSVAPHVKFGISPFGVWRNASTDPVLGSPSMAGIQSYDDLFADVRYWLEKGWIDYVAPQLYWHIGFEPADYEPLLNWWQDNAFGRQVYAGLAMYKVGTNADPAWRDAQQIPQQILLSRAYPNVQGAAFFNTNSLLKNRLRVKDKLTESLYRLPAIWPEMDYLNLPTSLPPNFAKPKMKKGKLKLTFNLNPNGEKGYYLVVYRFEDRRPGDYNNPENILKVVRINGENRITVEDDKAQAGKIYTYAASTMNRQHTESLLSQWRAISVGKKRIKKVK